MKRTIALITLFLSLICLFAQELPMNPSIKYGKLDNGLSYYIQKNSYPENRVSFYLLQRVGSIQEEDNQAGLAHFLEHMAFSGTQNFPSQLVNNLEKYGVRMFDDINARTGFDETVYNLSNIPANNRGLIDTCLLILHDWSGFISLRDEDIDKERRIIKEEWRSRTDARYRILDKQLSVIFEGSKYANRMPIGKMEIVENFEYQTLKDYYNKWYRPDLQTVIVVGDIDVDYIENQLMTIYKDIPAPVNAAERIYYPVKDNIEPIVSIETDKEFTNTNIVLYAKHDLYKGNKNTKEWLTQMYARNMLSSILLSRLEEITQTPESPYFSTYGGYDNFFESQTKDAWCVGADVKEGYVQEALEVLIREQERVKQYGFTESEVKRARANLQSGRLRIEQENDYLAHLIINHVLKNTPLTGIEYENNLLLEIIPEINKEMLQKIANDLITDQNLVLMISGPEKEGLLYPAKEELLSTMQRVRKEKVKGYIDTTPDEPLVGRLPPAGRIRKSKIGKKFGETIWTLSNGAKVVLKRTEYIENEIIMEAIAYGGDSHFDSLEYNELRFDNDVTNIGGLGNFSTINLNRILPEKSVKINSHIDMSVVSLNGRSSIEDIEILFQMMYLYLTSPRKDIESFKAFMERKRIELLNRSKNLSMIYADSITQTTYGDNLRTKALKIEDLDKLNYDRLIEIYREAFSNPGSFTFCFTGSVDEVMMKPLVEKYLACLPSGNKNMQFKESNPEIQKGDIKNHFRQTMEIPKAFSDIRFTSHIVRNADMVFTIEVLNNILSQTLYRALRDEESGIYGINANVEVVRKSSKDNTSLSISFTADPARLEEMNTIVYKELQELADNGPRLDEFNKAIESVVNMRTNWNQTNDFLVKMLWVYHFLGEDDNTDYANRIRGLKTSDIQDIMKNIMSAGNKIEVVMLPEEG